MYNPFNIFMQEYLCTRLSNLSSEQFRLLNSVEKSNILTKESIVKFVKKKSLFTILSVLTKVGVKWGIYIIDEDFNLDTYKQLVKNKDFASNHLAIKNAMKKSKSFITNSKYFAQLQNIIHNEGHGLEAVYERRFIEISENISSISRENFSSYNILHPEVEFKKASEGSLFMLDLFRNINSLKNKCIQRGITINDFILLCEYYYNSEKYYSAIEIVKVVGPRSERASKLLFKKGFLNYDNTLYNINTKGILLVGEIMADYLDKLYLK